MRTRLLLALTTLLAGCGFSVRTQPPGGLRAIEQEAFWRRLTALCGHAYPGRATETTDTVFVRHPLAIHVRDCSEREIRVGFIIGPDASRTWVVRRVDGGLSLRHDVQPADSGTVSGYGGLTHGGGTAARQDFVADQETGRLLPPAAQNVWTLEIDPGRRLDYAVGRPGVQRRFRLTFDLSRPIAPTVAR